MIFRITSPLETISPSLTAYSGIPDNGAERFKRTGLTAVFPLKTLPPVDPVSGAETATGDSCEVSGTGGGAASEAPAETVPANGKALVALLMADAGLVTPPPAMVGTETVASEAG
ncbi:MAG TPA: hypothetical protein PK997_04950 [Candidatus Omnitrophota bacterium]|nr:hypothetical protein [Candidatus Omnitrophota bacterium]